MTVSATVLHRQIRGVGSAAPSAPIRPDGSTNTANALFGATRHNVCGGDAVVTEVVAEEVPLVIGGQLPPALALAAASSLAAQRMGSEVDANTAAAASLNSMQQQQQQLTLPEGAYYPTLVPTYTLADCRLPHRVAESLAAGSNNDNSNNNKNSNSGGANHHQQQQQQQQQQPIKALRNFQQYAVPFLLQHASAALASMGTATTEEEKKKGSGDAAAPQQEQPADTKDETAVGAPLQFIPPTAKNTHSEGALNFPTNGTDASPNGLLPLPPNIAPLAAQQHSDKPAAPAAAALALVGTPGCGKTTAMAVSLATLLFQHVSALAAAERDRLVRAHTSASDATTTSTAATPTPISTSASGKQRTVGELATAAGPLAIVFASSQEAAAQYSAVLKTVLGPLLAEPIVPTTTNGATPSSVAAAADRKGISGGFGASKRERSRSRSRSRSRDGGRRRRDRSRDRSRSRSRSPRDRDRRGGGGRSGAESGARVVSRNLNSVRGALVVVQNAFSLERDVFLPHRLVAPPAPTTTSAAGANGAPSGHGHNHNRPPASHGHHHSHRGAQSNVTYNTLPASFAAATTRALLFLVLDPADVFVCPPLLNTCPAPFWSWLRSVGALTIGGANAGTQQPRVQVWLNHSCPPPPPAPPMVADFAVPLRAPRPTAAAGKAANLHTFLLDVLKREAVLTVRRANTGAWASVAHRVVGLPSPAAIVPAVFEQILQFMATSVTVTESITITTITTKSRPPPASASQPTAATLRLGAEPPVSATPTAPAAPEVTRTETSTISKAWPKCLVLFVANKTDATMLRQALTQAADTFVSPPTLVATYTKRPSASAAAAPAAPTRHSVPITAAEVRAFVAANVQLLTEWHVRSQTIPAAIAAVGRVVNLTCATAGANQQLALRRGHHHQAGAYPAYPPLPPDEQTPIVSETSHDGPSLFAAPPSEQLVAAAVEAAMSLEPAQEAPAAPPMTDAERQRALIEATFAAFVAPAAYAEMADELSTVSCLFGSRSRAAGNVMTTMLVGVRQGAPQPVSAAFAKLLSETNQSIPPILL